MVDIVTGTAVRWMYNATLSQKQLAKYLSLEIFTASIGAVPVLFYKISIQQHPRNKHL
jgi:hypothetical protein